jgi:hypothetical protein
VGFDGKVDMTFVTGRESSWLLSKVPVFGEMLRDINEQLPEIQRHLIQIQVTGPLEDPKAVLVPLPPAVNLVKGFFDLFRSTKVAPPAKLAPPVAPAPPGPLAPPEAK